MGLEIDWLEREERYRRRILRLMTGAAVLVGVLLAIFAYTGSRREKKARVAAAQAAAEAREAEAQRRRDAFVADSSAVANRIAAFNNTYKPAQIEALPLVEIPLPSGQPRPAFVRRLWSEYVRVLDPQASAEQEAELYKQYYVELMNDGPLRGRSILLPTLKQDGTKVSMEKPSFTDITRGQIVVGMREAPPEVPVDSTGATIAPDTSAAASQPTPSEAPPSSPPETPPAAPDTSPATPPPAPPDVAPVTPPAAAPPDSTPATAPPDTTPKP
jgi:hypothetical protein